MSKGGAVEEDEPAQREREEEQDPLCIADYITIKTPNGGFMSAEGVLDDSIVTRRTPELYDDCVFQICPQQQYSAAKELFEYKSELQADGFFDKTADEQSVASSARMVNPEDEEEPEEPRELKILKSLETGTSNEKELNKKYFEQKRGITLQFGNTVQLLHRKSGKYLTINPKEVATTERENLSVYLSPDGGNELSWFTIIPKYKIDREGDPILLRDCVVQFELAMRKKEFLHMAGEPSEGFVDPSAEAAEADGAKGDKKEASIAEGLEEPVDVVPEDPYKYAVYEVNCSLDATGWQICLFSRYQVEIDPDEADEGPKAEPIKLFAGDVVRLYDPEQRRHLRLARVNPSDPHRYDAGFVGRGEGIKDEDGDGASPDSNALWFIENFDNPDHGDQLIHKDEGYRLRHLNTGRCDTERRPPTPPQIHCARARLRASLTNII